VSFSKHFKFHFALKQIGGASGLTAMQQLQGDIQALIIASSYHRKQQPQKEKGRSKSPGQIPEIS